MGAHGPPVKSSGSVGKTAPEGGHILVDPGSVVRAFLACRAAIQAALGGAWGCIFRAEMGQRAAAAQAHAVLAEHPEKNIEIVAAFRQDHRAGPGCVVPVPTHVTVRHMPE